MQPFEQVAEALVHVIDIECGDFHCRAVWAKPSAAKRATPADSTRGWALRRNPAEDAKAMKTSNRACPSPEGKTSNRACPSPEGLVRRSSIHSWHDRDHSEVVTGGYDMRARNQ